MRAIVGERGVTLIETMIAILVAFIALSAIGGVVFSALISSKNQGVETTRMTAIANEKINELMRLSYSDTSTNTTLISTSTWDVGLTNGGGTDYSTSPCSSSTFTGYVDFLDASGNSLSGTTCTAAIASGYTFERRWQVAQVDDSGGNPIAGLKQITVVVYDVGAVSISGSYTSTATPPYVTLTTLKSQ